MDLLFEMAQFIKTIQNFAFQNNLWVEGSRIIVGVSGGPDSTCLLDILTFLRPKYKFELHVAHVSYGLRGKDSDKDELFVRKLGEKYGVQVSVLKPKKSDYKGNLENSLRDIRYEYFENLRTEMGFDLIAVAHNQDDQTETVLMRIIRGGGLNGLSAMKAKSGNIIRPLLGTSKEHILAYNKEKKLKFRLDKSNKDLSFTRNKIRHDLLPYLEKKFNPAVKETIANWSMTVADDYDFINRQSERFALAKCKNKCANFSAQAFLNLHIAIQRQALRNICRELSTSEYDIESGQVAEIIKLINSDKKKSPKSQIGGLNVLKKGDNIEIFC
ncbi:MAG: hypothetical protein ACD_56C00096G0001 [uncultured bacterium]|nr:MAG: hypothetical protein ACD_56C00096G0001 [uncultured bacterium]